MVDDEIKRLLDEAHARARTILTDNRPLLDRIAATLLERETIDREDMEKLVNDLPLPPRTLPTGEPAAPAPVPPKPTANPPRGILGIPPAEPQGA
jgi:cell division protease FtsH